MKVSLTAPSGDFDEVFWVKISDQENKKEKVPKEEEDNEPTAAEVQRVNVPFTDITIPVPQEEIMVTAATTAFISVAATLTATSLFKQCVKVFKPVIMQLAKRIQKKFTKNGNQSKGSASGA